MMNTVMVGSRAVSYREERGDGTGRVVLMVHGATDHSWIWKHQLVGLDSRHRRIAVEKPDRRQVLLKQLADGGLPRGNASRNHNGSHNNKSRFSAAPDSSPVPWSLRMVIRLDSSRRCRTPSVKP